MMSLLTDLHLESNSADQYLKFMIKNELFAVSIDKVREIKTYDKPTETPTTPNSMLGVINIRGQIVPVFDINCLFGLGQCPIEKYTLIIIVHVVDEAKDKLVGFLSNTFPHVIEIPKDKIQSTPETICIPKENVDGVYVNQDDFIAILNVDSLLEVPSC